MPTKIGLVYIEQLLSPEWGQKQLANSIKCLLEGFASAQKVSREYFVEFHCTKRDISTKNDSINQKKERVIYREYL